MDIKYFLNQFGINDNPIYVTKITSGHINSTFLAELINRKIVIQSLNRDIFKNCADIMYNIRIINNIFEKHPESDVKAVEFYKALSGLNFIEHNNCIYRICDYIDSEKNNSPLYTGYAYGKFRLFPYYYTRFSQLFRLFSEAYKSSRMFIDKQNYFNAFILA